MEEWRNVPGFKGTYQVDISTKQGRCRRILPNGETRELTIKPNKRSNRLFWTLWKENKPTCLQAARWIAITFPELVQNEYFEGAEIDHIDTDVLNNHPSNLRWVTRKGNLNNPLTRQHNSQAKKGKKLSEEHKKKISASKGFCVIQLSLNNEVLNYYPSAKQAEKETGIANSSINRCCKGERKTAGRKNPITGKWERFIWRFAI